MSTTDGIKTQETPRDIVRRATISPCGRYRYRLTRYWGPGLFLPFVMLNPSTADAEIDDPTIRRCMGFARREGFGGILVVNLYGLRATEPAELRKTADPFGPDNRKTLHNTAQEASLLETPIVCAWGANGWYQSADRDVTNLLRETGAKLVCLGTTKAGHPKHPLYIKSSEPLVPFA